MRDITLLFVFFIAAFAACKFTGSKRITGNRNVITQQRNISNFNALEVSGSIDVYVTQGAEYAVKVEAEENLMDYIIVEKDGDALDVHFKDNHSITSHSPVKVYVTAPSYSHLAVSGSGDIISQTKITHSNKLDIDIAGSGDIRVEVDAPAVSAEIGGSGSIFLKGTTRDFSAEIAGSGELKAYDLLSENMDIDIAGSGDAEVYASKKLDISVAGAGNVNYKGNPTVSQSIAGSGNIKKVG
jgi:hypothetical protein